MVALWNQTFAYKHSSEPPTPRYSPIKNLLRGSIARQYSLVPPQHHENAARAHSNRTRCPLFISYHSHKCEKANSAELDKSIEHHQSQQNRSVHTTKHPRILPRNKPNLYFLLNKYRHLYYSTRSSQKAKPVSDLNICSI